MNKIKCKDTKDKVSQYAPSAVHYTMDQFKKSLLKLIHMLQSNLNSSEWCIGCQIWLGGYLYMPGVFESLGTSIIREAHLGCTFLSESLDREWTMLQKLSF